MIECLIGFFRENNRSSSRKLQQLHQVRDSSNTYTSNTYIPTVATSDQSSSQRAAIRSLPTALAHDNSLARGTYYSGKMEEPKYGIPLFVSIVQQRKRLSEIVCFEIERFLGCYAREMTDLLKIETENLLQKKEHLVPADSEAFRAYYFAIVKENESGTSLTNSLSILYGMGKAPQCLLGALAKNLMFCYYAVEFCSGVYHEAGKWLKTLDNDRDSEEEIETTIRLFPTLLLGSRCSKPEPIVTTAARNFKSVSFVPLLAKLGLEFGRVNDRGGLLAYNELDMNALRYIAGGAPTKALCKEKWIRTEQTNLRALRELRDQNLCFKEDIRREDLVVCVLTSMGFGIRGESYFAEQRFRFFADWDPMLLARERQRHFDGILPLHITVWNFEMVGPGTSQAFRTVFESGIKHFPTRLGFMFHVDTCDRTPFEMACDKFGTREVTELVQDVLSANNYDTKKTLESLMFLAVDETAHLEGVYMILRRDPSIIARAALSGARPHACHQKQKRKREIAHGGRTDDGDNAGEIKQCIL